MRGRPSRTRATGRRLGNSAAGGRAARTDLMFSRAFLDAGGKAVVTANSGPLRWPRNLRRMRLCARSAVLPAGIPGRRPRVPGWPSGGVAGRPRGPWQARPGAVRCGAAGAGAGWAGRRGSGYSQDPFGLLPRTTPTIGHLPWPERRSARIRLITHSKIGLGLAGQVLRRAETTAGRQPLGVDTRLCVGGVVIRSCLGSCLVLARSESFGFLLVIQL